MGELTPWVRRLSKAATSVQRSLLSGSPKGGTLGLPMLTTPPLPPEPPREGALKRVFNLGQTIKHRSGYTEAMGKALGIVRNHYVQESASPVFTLKVLRAGQGEVVRGKFKRFGHKAVYVESRRGNGLWERFGPGLGVYHRAHFVDDRPLLTPGVPEARECRLCFWDDDSPTGEWSPVASATVSP